MYRSQVKCLRCALCVTKRVRVQLTINRLLLAATQFISLQTVFYCVSLFSVYFFFLLQLHVIHFSIKASNGFIHHALVYLEVDGTNETIGCVAIQSASVQWMCASVGLLLVCASIHEMRSNNQITTNPIYFYWLRFNSQTHTQKDTKKSRKLAVLSACITSQLLQWNQIYNKSREWKKKRTTTKRQWMEKSVSASACVVCVCMSINTFCTSIYTAFCGDRAEHDFYWFANDLNTFTPVNFIFGLHVIWICLCCFFFCTKKLLVNAEEIKI